MIRNFEFYHGLVFARILHEGGHPISLRTFPSSSNASYVVNDDISIFIKYSAKRMTPWRFTFAPEHQAEIAVLQGEFSKFFLLLVCNDDGVVCLNSSELKEILDNEYDTTEWISVVRHRREMYLVRGSNGTLDWKVARSAFPRKLFSELQK